MLTPQKKKKIYCCKIQVCSTLTIKGRILLTNLWKLKLSLGEIIPIEYQKTWNNLFKELVQLSSYNLPGVDLYLFCDTSKRANDFASYKRLDSIAALILLRSRQHP